MSIWGKVMGGVAGFAVGGPFGALMGAFAGHMMVDKKAGHSQPFFRPGGFGETLGGPFGGFGTIADRQTVFTIAVIVLGAKMAKADGRVTPDEVRAFKEVFHIPPEEMETVGRLFNEAKKDAAGFEPYAAQVAQLFAHEPAMLEELLGGLFHIAKAGGGVTEAELTFLSRVAAIFGFDGRTFERIRAVHLGGTGGAGEWGDPYAVLGLTREASDDEVKHTYRQLIRENHPDTLIAKGVPQEFIDLATQKMATINAAYDRIAKARGLR